MANEIDDTGLESALDEDLSDAPERSAPSSGTVQALSRMVKEMEEQLDRMIAINEGVERDLATERKRNGELEASVQHLTVELERAEKQAAAREDMVAEIRHLNRDRTRLGEEAEKLRAQLKELHEEKRKAAAMIERVKLERADALEEVQTVESQFDRAMAMVADLRTRLAVLSEEYDALKGRFHHTEEKVATLEHERETLLAEVEESRAALEEIRRSLVDAYGVSQPRRTEDESTTE